MTTYRATFVPTRNYSRQLNSGATLESLGAVYQGGKPHSYLITDPQAVALARKAGFAITAES